MLKREYQELTGTKVYPDVYEGIIEPMYSEAPAWMLKSDFCKSINAVFMSNIPAVPDYNYMIDNVPFKCVKIDLTNQTVTLEGLTTGNIIKLRFEIARAWRKRDYMKWI